MPTADTSPGQQTMSGGHGDNHPFKITVRTLAGHHVAETGEAGRRCCGADRQAVKHFVAKGEMVAGDYALTLPRAGGVAELDTTATLRDTEVVEGDMLVLVEPQASGLNVHIAIDVPGLHHNIHDARYGVVHAGPRRNIGHCAAAQLCVNGMIKG